MGTRKIAARKIAPVPNHNPGGGGEFVGGQSPGVQFYGGQFPGHQIFYFMKIPVKAFHLMILSDLSTEPTIERCFVK